MCCGEAGCPAPNNQAQADPNSGNAFFINTTAGFVQTFPGPCPACGRCPHCGQPKPPYYPYGQPYVQPWSPLPITPWNPPPFYVSNGTTATVTYSNQPVNIN